MTVIPLAPKVTVIIATRNRAHFLKESVDSVLAQTFKDFELIIVDDNSQDCTAQLLENIRQNDPRVRTFRLDQNLGPGAARNFAAAKAKGTYLAILDDDDIAFLERLEIENRYLDKNPEVGCVFSSAYFCVQTSDGKIQEIQMPQSLEIGFFPKTSEKIFEFLYLGKNVIPHSSVLMRKSAFELVGGYEAYPYRGEDRLFFLKMAALGIKIDVLDEILVRMRQGGDHEQLTKNSFKGKMEDKRKVLQLIRRWLRKAKIEKFDHLHKKAFINQLLQESRFWGGYKGVLRTIQAALLDFSDADVQRRLEQYFKKIRNLKLCMLRM